ncbi:MAG: Type 1 glutamine amidotransferase-like domain-containing protein [Candidatus Paceibacterota bacterium]|jgi:hypothetical protein
MIKFVLHGGFNKDEGYIKDGFFQEALKDTPEKVKLFLVFFAEFEDRLELRINQCKEQFNHNKGSKSLEFRMASKENFLEGCSWADVIFLSGGRTARLMESLGQFQSLEQVFAGKTVVGDSAGVNVLGCYSYSRKTDEVTKGLGILPFKIVVHYIEAMGNPLAGVEPDLETLFLHEYETVVKHYV